MRHIAGVIGAALALALLPAGPAPGQETTAAVAGFVPGVADLPLMAGLEADPEATMVFDKPDGRIVEAAAFGAVSPEAVLAFFNSFLSPEVGKRWLDNVMVQTGIVSDPSKISSRQASDYFQMIARTNAGSKYFFGIPIQVLQGKAKEVFTQVINNAFPAGNISVEDAVEQMKAAY